MEGHLLLAKVFYAMGSYNEALKCYEKLDLNNISLTSSNSYDRRLQLIAEAFAMKGT